MKNMLWAIVILSGLAPNAYAADARCKPAPAITADSVEEARIITMTHTALCKAGIYPGLEVNRAMNQLRKSGWLIDAGITCGEGWDTVCSFETHKEGMKATIYLHYNRCAPEDGCKESSKQFISSWEAYR